MGPGGLRGGRTGGVRIGVNGSRGRRGKRSYRRIDTRQTAKILQEGRRAGVKMSERN